MYSLHSGSKVKLQSHSHLGSSQRSNFRPIPTHSNSLPPIPNERMELFPLWFWYCSRLSLWREQLKYWYCFSFSNNEWQFLLSFSIKINLSNQISVEYLLFYDWTTFTLSMDKQYFPSAVFHECAIEMSRVETVRYMWWCDKYRLYFQYFSFQCLHLHPNLFSYWASNNGLRELFQNFFKIIDVF